MTEEKTKKKAKNTEKKDVPKEEPTGQKPETAKMEEAKPTETPAAKPVTGDPKPATPDQKPVAQDSKPASAPVQTRPTKRRIATVHVFSSKNDTIITATDQSGAETLAWASGGMMVKSDREEGRPYAAMQAALKVMSNLKEKGITFVNIKIRAPGGNGSKTPGPGAQAVVRTIARTGVRIGRIDDVTPLPTDSMKVKGGRRGRRV